MIGELRSPPRPGRAFLHEFDIGCSLPIAAYARVTGDQLRLQGRVIALDGGRQVDVAGETTAIAGQPSDVLAQQLGLDLAENARELGGEEILQAIDIGEA